jgi:hypothetical protein
MTIYTIGYQRLASPQRLLQIAVGLDAVVWDCRSKPVSRRKGFGGEQLAQLLDHRYIWRGNVLGGKGQHATAEGIAMLEAHSKHGNILLLCLEEAPGECHRHHDICGPHFPDAIHIWRDELLTARSLTHDFVTDEAYVPCGSLANTLSNNRIKSSPET